MANPTSSDDEPAYMKALNAARNGDKTVLDGPDGEALAKAGNELWLRVEGNPNYLLSRDEFALFNYYRKQYEKTAENKETVRKAVARFWDNYREDRPSSSSRS